MFLLLTFCLAGCEGPPGAAGRIVARIPDDDTYVVETDGASVTHFTETKLLASSQSPVEVSYMKFDLSAFSNIASASLQFRALRVSASPVTVTLFGTGGNWGGELITFVTQPARGPALGTVTVDTLEGGLYEVDVTAYTLSQFVGPASEISLAFVSSNGSVEIGSSESTDERPHLLVTPF